MPKSHLCDSKNPYILASEAITAVEPGADSESIAADKNNEQAIFKNCAMSTDCINEINKT